MSKTSSVISLADELSSEIAAAILTKQEELNRDPRELLAIVSEVHITLKELSIECEQHLSHSLEPVN